LPFGIVVYAYVLIVTGTAWPAVVVIIASATLLTNLLLAIPKDLKNQWSRAEVWRSRSFEFFSSAVVATMIMGLDLIAFDDVGAPPSLSSYLLWFLGGVLVITIAIFLLAVLFRQPKNIFRIRGEPLR
jgi:ABC-type transport system involved in multi-copper enzyme maturation permease subunit